MLRVNGGVYGLFVLLWVRRGRRRDLKGHSSMCMHDCCPCLGYVMHWLPRMRTLKASGDADLPCASRLCCQCFEWCMTDARDVRQGLGMGVQSKPVLLGTAILLAYPSYQASHHSPACCACLSAVACPYNITISRAPPARPF